PGGPSCSSRGGDVLGDCGTRDVTVTSGAPDVEGSTVASCRGRAAPCEEHDGCEQDGEELAPAGARAPRSWRRQRRGRRSQGSRVTAEELAPTGARAASTTARSWGPTGSGGGAGRRRGRCGRPGRARDRSTAGRA